MAQTFILRVDSRTKEVLLKALRRELDEAEKEVVVDEDYSREALLRYEELATLVRGITMATPHIAPPAPAPKEEEPAGYKPESIDIDL